MHARRRATDRWRCKIDGDVRRQTTRVTPFTSSRSSRRRLVVVATRPSHVPPGAEQSGSQSVTCRCARKRRRRATGSNTSSAQRRRSGDQRAEPQKSPRTGGHDSAPRRGRASAWAISISHDSVVDDFPGPEAETRPAEPTGVLSRVASLVSRVPCRSHAAARYLRHHDGRCRTLPALEGRPHPLPLRRPVNAPSPTRAPPALTRDGCLRAVTRRTSHVQPRSTRGHAEAPAFVQRGGRTAAAGDGWGCRVSARSVGVRSVGVRSQGGECRRVGARRWGLRVPWCAAGGWCGRVQPAARRPA
jgi:hypothetical protein